jgi:Stress responsive A/B Barrel Domain
MIRHIVTWKFVDQDASAKSAAFDQLAEGFGALPHVIPEIKTLHLGRDVGEVASNWDVALIIDFASTADLDVYQAHPAHEKVKAIVRSLTGERSAIDFEL